MFQFFWLLVVLCISRKTLSDNIKIDSQLDFCDINNLKTMVNLDSTCQHENNFDTTYPNQYVLVAFSKQKYILDSVGYQCSKKMFTRYLNTSFFGYQSENTITQVVPITHIECMAMVSSKKCESRPMTCDDGGCWYDKEPTGEFEWYTSVRLTGPYCKFFKRRVIAIDNKTQVFSNSRSPCTPDTGFCILADQSIVYWKKSDIHSSLYSPVNYGKAYNRSGNILYSSETRFLYQLTNTVVQEFGYDLQLSTEGLWIYFESCKNVLCRNEDTYRMEKVLKSFDAISQQSNSNKQQTMDLLLAEEDFNMYNIGRLVENTMIEDCVVLLNQLRSLTLVPNRFHRVRDLQDKKMIIYSKFSQLFIPSCKKIKDQIEIMSEEETNGDDVCFTYLPVRMISSDFSKETSLFLTTDNIVVDHSSKISCNLINSRHMLNSSHFIIRQGKRVSLSRVADLHVIDLNGQFNFDVLNFAHHSEIIHGFETISKQEGQTRSDIEETFETIPDDHIDHLSFVEEASHRVTGFVRSSYQKVKNFIIYVLLCIGAIVIALAIIWICSRGYCGGLCRVIFCKQKPRNLATINNTDSDIEDIHV